MRQLLVRAVRACGWSEVDDGPVPSAMQRGRTMDAPRARDKRRCCPPRRWSLRAGQAMS
jgi:hypothetical protein